MDQYCTNCEIPKLRKIKQAWQENAQKLVGYVKNHTASYLAFLEGSAMVRQPIGLTLEYLPKWLPQTQNLASWKPIFLTAVPSIALICSSKLKDT